MRLRSIAGLVAIAAGLTGCGMMGGAPYAAPRPDLSGTWVLNRAESSDSAVLDGVLTDTIAWRRITEDVTSAGGARDAESYAAYIRRRSAAERATIEALRATPARFTVTQADSLLGIEADGAPAVLVPVGGGAVATVWIDGRSADVRARWNAGRLEVERRLEDGVRIMEYYSRSPAGSRMVVFAEVDAGFGMHFTLRRVYDEADPAVRRGDHGPA